MSDKPAPPLAPALLDACAPTLDGPADPPARADEDQAPTLDVSPGGVTARAPISTPAIPHLGVPRVLKHWDRYEVQELIGAGGMGAVYKARDPRLGRLVALKLIHPQLGGSLSNVSSALLRHFQREARLQATLDHKNICRVYEIGELPALDDSPACPYIAMQYIVGQPLHHALPGLTLPEKLQLFIAIADALHHAHRHGLVHRDIKPSNILVERTLDGTLHPYVLDFGIAREISTGEQTRSGVIEGTPRYMAPEQARGETRRLDRRTDVFSLGVTLYEMLTLRSPYAGLSDVDVLMAILLKEPLPPRQIDPSIPVDLEAIALKCMEKEPSARYDSARALGEDLQRYLNGDPVQARRLSPVRRLLKQARKHKVLVGLGSTLFLCLISIILYGWRTRVTLAEKERQAQQHATARATLAQYLTQELKDLEWMLRSARQLPIHNIAHEEKLVQERIQALELQLKNGTEPGLIHAALGRGYYALQDHKKALEHLTRAANLGQNDQTFHAALGLAYGKHFEQAMADARLSGGGSFAQDQLKKIEPIYLTPAIASLEKSKGLHSDLTEYLEALLAYYQHQEDRALQLAAQAAQQAPWIYESHRLSGDIEHEHALATRDRGDYEKAEQHFAASVKHYERAIEIAPSDEQNYVALAESWVRQVEMASNRGRNSDVENSRLLLLSTKIKTINNASTKWQLKTSAAIIFRELLPLISSDSSTNTQACIRETRNILNIEPDNQLASYLNSICNHILGLIADRNGTDPTPQYELSIRTLEASIQRNPTFLWGINDLANTYTELKALQLKKGIIQDTLSERINELCDSALKLDPSYRPPNELKLWNLASDVARRINVSTDATLNKGAQLIRQCTFKNQNSTNCYINYGMSVTNLAQRNLRNNQDITPLLKIAQSTFETCTKLGCDYVDAQQHMTLMHWVDAMDRVRRGEDPGPALGELEAARQRCLKLEAGEPMCWSLGAQAQWAVAEWAQRQGKSGLLALRVGLPMAKKAMEDPRLNPDGWQVLAETHLRLAQAVGKDRRARSESIDAGLSACARALGINPRHPLALQTRGALRLMQGATESTDALRKQRGTEALADLRTAAAHDAMLGPHHQALMAEAMKLGSTTE